MTNTVDVLIVGGGAAGIGASLRLTGAQVPHMIVEARPRLGGRGWTIDETDYALDMGCGWLHSADENPWTDIAIAQGRAIDRTPPPWTRPSTNIDMPLDAQADFGRAFGAFYDKLHAAKDEPDRPASSLLEPGGRWNTLLNTVSTYINGAELDRVSMHDFALYRDTEINWRIKEGYGATIVAAAGENVLLDCPVAEIDHSGSLVSVHTMKGMLTAKTVIVTISSALVAAERIRFTPALPEKAEAAGNLPLGLADKLFLSLDRPEEFEKDSRVFGHPKDVGTAAYHIRPFGRSLIEAFFGGSLAEDLEREGGHAFVDFATHELTGLMGSDFARRIRPVRLSQWRKDEFARGSYSYAKPGHHNDRERLAQPVDNRIFFAGEACSPTSYSTVHGAYHTGVAAAGQAMAALGYAGSSGAG